MVARIDPEAQVIVNEGLVHLVRMKTTLADRLLGPAGVPAQVYHPAFVYLPSGMLSLAHRKQAADQVVESILALPVGSELIDELVTVIAGWTDFETAEDALAAQALVRRAKRLVKHQQVTHPLESLRAEMTQPKGLVPVQPASSEMQLASPQASLLLRLWREALQQPDLASQAARVQELLNRLFLVQKMILTRRFAPSAGDHAVEAMLTLAGASQRIECRWSRPYDPPPAHTIQLTAEDIQAVLTGAQELRPLVESKLRRYQ